MKKIILTFASAVLLLASCGKSELCGCVDTRLSMLKELKEAGMDDDAKRDEIREKYEKDRKKCSDLAKDKSKEEVKKMEEEMKECGSYEELEKLRKEERD